METTWVIPPSKLHRKEYVETTWIFRSSKLHQKKYVEIAWIFRPAKITSKKVSGNEVDFSTIEITSKKYAIMTWKFVQIWSLMYRRNIHVQLTSIRRGVPVEKELGVQLSHKHPLNSLT